jgi:RNA polymerase sigma factor (sigma-70 family)
MTISMAEPRINNPDDLAATLMENLAAFQGFARRRTGDDDLAADAVQESLLRAMKAEPTLAHREDLIAWFYRILRNVLTDLHRRKSAQNRTMDRFADDFADSSQSSTEFEAVACRCFRSLLPTLKPEYSRVIEICDLDGETPEKAALVLGISKNNLKVRLHRARGQLRIRLQQTCQLCATHGCLDCDCAPHS